MFSSLEARARARSEAILLSLEHRLDRLLYLWLYAAAAASALRLASGTVGVGPFSFATLMPYLLLVVAPFASALMALRWFADGERHAQPEIRLARVGTWRAVSPAEARKDRLYGTSGIMVSLLIGMLLNVPVRALEYLAAMPPVAAGAPAWVTTLSVAMTFDVVLFTSLYTIAFVAALRKVPLFPRLLVAIWAADIAAQLLIAQSVGAAPGLPVEVASALKSLLSGNVTKVLISVSLWLPYLLLSRRVNVTYRLRVPA